MGRSSKLYNKDLAPTSSSEKKWGWFEIFNVWANDVQSLFGYTLAASLFIASGLNGWAVFLALILAGFFIMWLVNLSGKPSVKHGIPYPVFARVSMGVFGANFPAMARGLVAMFWYGAQTYAASTAVALLITGLTGIQGEPVLLGMSGVMWISFIFDMICFFSKLYIIKYIWSLSDITNNKLFSFIIFTSLILSVLLKFKE